MAGLWLPEERPAHRTPHHVVYPREGEWEKLKLKQQQGGGGWPLLANFIRFGEFEKETTRETGGAEDEAMGRCRQSAR